MYIPNTPQTSEKAKMNFLSQLAIEKNCPLVATIDLDQSHLFGKLSNDYGNVLIHGTSLKRMFHAKTSSAFD